MKKIRSKLVYIMEKNSLYLWNLVDKGKSTMLFQ